ncbi:MAG: glycosyltransferase family 4 protein, partial [Nitrospirales bacterium]|nr:glycosyltransferase family 4 protein [Nitrospirales bacterium]
MRRLFFIKKRFSPHGGAENYLRTLMDRLKGEFEINVLSHAWVPTEGIRFHRVPVVNAGSYLSTATFNRNACALLRELRASCTVSFERTTCQDIYRAGEGCHAEWLAIRGRTEPFYKKISFSLNPLHRLLLSLEQKLFATTGRIVANSGMVKGQIIRHYGVREEKITVLHNGVDLERFTPGNRERWRGEVRERLGLREGEKTVLFVGSGFRRKGLGTLLEAFALLQEPHRRLLVAGKGETEAYRELAKERGISGRVVFLGPYREIEGLYAASDLFVLPTLYDPFSNATLEAMASGLPVITSRNNGAAEIIGEGQ